MLITLLLIVLICLSFFFLSQKRVEDISLPRSCIVLKTKSLLRNIMPSPFQFKANFCIQILIKSFFLLILILVYHSIWFLLTNSGGLLKHLDFQMFDCCCLDSFVDSNPDLSERSKTENIKLRKLCIDLKGELLDMKNCLINHRF